MGLIGQMMTLLFGDGRNVVAQTAEVFRENAENAAKRSSDVQTETLKQFAAEFAHARKGLFDRFVDAINRLPRPLLALGTIGLFVSAMYDPEWFASRMAGIALVPEPLWWLMGAIVSFYFGARHQAKGQEFQRSVAQTAALGAALGTPSAKAKPQPDPEPEPAIDRSVPPPTGRFSDNAALSAWEASHAR